MKIFKNSILFSLIALFLWQCDTIDGKFIEDNNSLCGDASLPVPIKKVILEDYTGFRCGNCPRAAEKIEELSPVYCDHIIPVSIHVGYFATPSGSTYTSDYRTPEGTAYNDYFGSESAGLPVGMVNRTEFNGKKLLAHDDWSAAILAQINQAPKLDIIINPEYLPDDSSFNLKIETGFLKTISQKLMLNIWLVEDSIIDWQKDYDAKPQDIEGYIHNHLFRESLTDIWGSELSGNTTQNSFINSDFSGKLNNKYKPNEIYIVAFVAVKESREILQASMKKLKAN